MTFASASVTNRGFSFVYREDGQRRIPVQSTRGRFAVSGIITALFRSREWISSVCIAGS